MADFDGLITDINTNGKLIVKSIGDVAKIMVPVIGFTITGVVVIWGVKRGTIDIIEIIDRGVDIKRN